jgi:hypothetical protein
MVLVMVDVGYACYGIECEKQVVVTAPPIAKWMIGKKTDFIKIWITRKNGTYEIVN